MSEEEGGDKRRASPRVKCRWSMMCVTEQKKTFNAKCVNISQGGIMFTSPVSLNKGGQLYLEIAGYFSGAHHTIKVVGKIACVGISSGNEIQIGLQFTSKLSLECNKFLTGYIRNCLLYTSPSPRD